MNKKNKGPDGFAEFLQLRRRELAGVDAQKLLLAALAGVAEGRHNPRNEAHI